MEPPTSNTGAAAVSVGLLAAGATVGGVLGNVAARKMPSDRRMGAAAVGTITGVMAAGLAGVATAALSEKWRRLGLWTAGIGLGGVTAAMVFAEGRSLGQAPPSSQPQPAGLPPGPGSQQNDAAAQLLVRAGAMNVTVPVGGKLTLVLPPGGHLATISAPALPTQPIKGTWLTLSVPGAGIVTLGWTDAAGTPQATNVTVTN